MVSGGFTEDEGEIDLGFVGLRKRKNVRFVSGEERNGWLV